MDGPNDPSASLAKVNYDGLVHARIAPIQEINPYSCDSDSVKEAVHHYDTELKALADTQAALATRRNTVVQSSRIPPEILTQIFKEVINLHPTKHDGPPHHERIPPVYPMLANLPLIPMPLPGWLPLSQVCRRWWDVLFQDQRLWTEVKYATSLAWLKECLARSKDLPITLHRYIPYGYPPWQRNLTEFSTINEHLFVIRKLIVLMNPGSMIYTVPLTNPAPLLESLTLSRYHIGIPGEPRQDPGYEPVVDPLSNELLAGKAPALRKLVLSGFTLNWVMSPLIMPSITHFELQFPPYAVVQNMDMPDEPDVSDPLAEPLRAQLFLCLQRMPMLEILKLDNCWPVSSADDPWPPRHRRPVFAHLCSLTVAGEMMPCTGFLEHCVTVPTSASVSVLCSVAKRDIQDDDLDVEELLSVVPAYICRLSTGRHISASALEFSTSAGGSGIKLWRSKADEPLENEREPFVTVSFNSKPNPLAQAVLPMLRKLISTLQLPDARLLSLSCCFSEMRRVRLVTAVIEMMVQLLGRCTRIEHLVFNMHAVDILLRLMEASGVPPDAPGGAENGNHPDVSRSFRELSTISLFDTKRAEPADIFESKQPVRSPFPDAKFFGTFMPHLVALREEGHLQVLNVPWEDIEAWKSQFEGMVPICPELEEMRRYMDWQ